MTTDKEDEPTRKKTNPPPPPPPPPPPQGTKPKKKQQPQQQKQQQQQEQHRLQAGYQHHHNNDKDKQQPSNENDDDHVRSLSANKKNNPKKTDENGNGDGVSSKRRLAGAVASQESNLQQRQQQQQQQPNMTYPPHWKLPVCLEAYRNTTAETVAALVAASTTSTSTSFITRKASRSDATSDSTTATTTNAAAAAAAASVVVRGILRVLPGNDQTSAGFVTCDKGLFRTDILIATALERNRAMDGETVFVEIITTVKVTTPTAHAQEEDIDDNESGNDDTESTDDEAGDRIVKDWQHHHHHHQKQEEAQQDKLTWQDDDGQMNLWNPVIPDIPLPSKRTTTAAATTGARTEARVLVAAPPRQFQGRVVHILPRKVFGSEIIKDGSLSTTTTKIPSRRIVGSLKVLSSGTTLLTPNNRCLPQFRCSDSDAVKIQTLLKKLKEKKQRRRDQNNHVDENDDDGDDILDPDELLYQAEYVYGSWKETFKWPPCINLEAVGSAFVIEDAVKCLLRQHELDHGDFSATILQSVQQAVDSSGSFVDSAKSINNKENGKVAELVWEPTPDLYKGRRDYRSERIFTIDPTTAKDLDDALHCKLLPCGTRVEIGVHIADVSFFVRPYSPVDLEAQRRATTVYLVDRTIPMLPRPLCEMACSLNENVERLAFSCVWTMNLDGTIRHNEGKKEGEVWYGRTVIKSCARLDYATAQNIIENKVATTTGESQQNLDDQETLWPKSRRPTGGHTMEQVAADVRLMHRVAVARRKLRFDNGALALNGIKLAFQLDADGQTPLLAKPYPIRDSNRLVEEYMLLANYFVAQRLITHAGGKALLRQHPEPVEEGLDKVVDVAKASIGFDIDITNSQTLHDSLHRLRQQCNNDELVLQCVTQMLMVPMQPADYFAAGMVDKAEWRHFALNIPYYTHFTSPIRRYPDILVHRLLQATIDGEQAVKDFPLEPKDIHEVCNHCNSMRMASKKAQEECDSIFLAVYARKNPLGSRLGIVLSIGVSTFTVFVPEIGCSTPLYLQEHRDVLSYEPKSEPDGSRVIQLRQKSTTISGSESKNNNNIHEWGTIHIRIFTKLLVTVHCSTKPPVSIKLRLQGPWNGGENHKSLE